MAEKPLTLDFIECVESTRFAQKQQRQLLVDHTYLFNPAVIKEKEVVQSEKLGDLRYGYASRTHLGPVRQEVDALWDLAIHDIAMFNYWLGETPVEVEAKGQVFLQSGLADLVWGTLTYPGGFQAHLHLCWSNPDKQRKLCLVGSEGTLIFDEMSEDSPLTLQRGYLQQKEGKFIPQGNSCEVITFPVGEPLKNLCARFLENIISGNYTSISDGLVGTDLVRVLQALTLSLETDEKKIYVQEVS